MSIEFNTIIQEVDGKNGAYIEMPFDVEKEFGSKRVKVKATFDGVEYRGSIVKMGLPCYIIGITKEIRTKIQKNPGDTVFVTIEKDEEVRKIVMPEDFMEVLNQHASAKEFYESLSYSAQRKYEQWITGAKKEETRQKRIQEAMEKLANQVKL